VPALFAGTALTSVTVPRPVGAASALKLAFATYNKVSTVRAAQAHALARRRGVETQLRELAAAALLGTPLATPYRLPSAGHCAWRWPPEMSEIATASRDADLPADLIDAAATFLDHWRQHKDDPSVTRGQLPEALSRPRT
jgi:uncharacterized protein DUF1932